MQEVRGRRRERTMPLPLWFAHTSLLSSSVNVEAEEVSKNECSSGSHSAPAPQPFERSTLSRALCCCSIQSMADLTPSAFCGYSLVRSLVCNRNYSRQSLDIRGQGCPTTALIPAVSVTERTESPHPCSFPLPFLIPK